MSESAHLVDVKVPCKTSTALLHERQPHLRRAVILQSDVFLETTCSGWPLPMIPARDSNSSQQPPSAPNCLRKHRQSTSAHGRPVVIPEEA